MTQEEIIEMVMQIGGCDRPEHDSPALKMFVAFAKLVAEKEREACAKIADGAQDDITFIGNTAVTVATAIMARGQV